jgi:regulator of sigma E protease
LIEQGDFMEVLLSMLSHWQGVVAVVAVLGGLIFFHEFGHFALARLFGLGVRTFSLGFGPRLWSRRRGKTDYCLSLVPLGGYVALVGQGGVEEELESDPDDDRVFSGEELFCNRPAWQRMLVIAAGPVANFVLAWLIYCCLALAQGTSYLLPVIGTVMPDSPAASAGFAPGDVITGINKAAVTEWMQVSQAINASGGSVVDVEVRRGDGSVVLRVTPRPAERTTVFGEKVAAWQIGIVAEGTSGHVPLGPGAALVQGARDTWTMTRLTFEGIVKLCQRIVPLDSVGGPILIAQTVGQQAQEGVLRVLAVAALISVNLGLLNLLPIPVLDGGHIAFLALEMLFRRPVSLKVQEFSARVGLVFLIGLMLFATWNDIMRLLS